MAFNQFSFANKAEGKIKNYARKALAGMVVLGVFAVAGFSQAREQKNPKAIGQTVEGTVDFDAPAISQTFSLMSADTAGGLTGEYSVGSGIVNGHYLGFVREGQIYRVDVLGLNGFDPVAMTVRAKLDTSNPSTAVSINDDCSGGTHDSCLNLQAGGDGPIVLFVRGFSYSAGRYRLAISIE